MTIKWQNKMSVDGDVIDADHRYLFKIINKFQNKVGKFQSRSEAEELLFELKWYALRHFAREEGLQRDAMFSDHKKHQERHDTLLRQLDEMVAETQKANKNTINELSKKLSGILDHCLLDHIFAEDFKMKSCAEFMQVEKRNLPLLEDI